MIRGETSGNPRDRRLCPCRREPDLGDRSARLVGFGDPLPQGLVDYTTGFGDALSLNITSLIRDQMGTNGEVDKCSAAYRFEGYTSLALGSGRLAYAGLAKGLSIAAASGAEASAIRSSLRIVFGAGGSLR